MMVCSLQQEPPVAFEHIFRYVLLLARVGPYRHVFRTTQSNEVCGECIAVIIGHRSEVCTCVESANIAHILPMVRLD